MKRGGAEALSPSEIKRVLGCYRFVTQTGNPDGWEDGTQEKLFELLLEVEALSGTAIMERTCLDVGCGTGRFYDFWTQREGEHYTGIDISVSAIREARLFCPEAVILHDEFLGWDIPHNFDFSFCSGMLTTKIPGRDMSQYLLAVIAKIWRHTNVAVSFNFLTSHIRNQDDDCTYYDPQRVVTAVESFSGNNTQVKLTGDERIATVYMWK